MAASMSGTPGGAAPIRPGTAPPGSSLRRIPTPVLVIGGSAVLMVVYIWWKRRGSADDGGGAVPPDSMGYYQYSPGGAGSSSDSEVLQGLDRLTDSVNRWIDGEGRDGTPVYEQPPNPVPVAPPSTPGVIGAGGQAMTYTPADVAAMFERAGKEVEFAGSGETPQQGLERLARELNLGIKTPGRVQASINIRPR